MKLGSVRKLRAAGRLMLFHYVLRAKRHTPATYLVSSLADLAWSLATDTGNKGNIGKGNTTARPLHSALPRFGARILRAEADVATQSNHSGVCVELHVPTPRNPTGVIPELPRGRIEYCAGPSLSPKKTQVIFIRNRGSTATTKKVVITTKKKSITISGVWGAAVFGCSCGCYSAAFHALIANAPSPTGF